MTTTYTTNLNLALQGTGDNSGTWGSVLNTAAFNILDTALGGVQTVSLSSTDVTLTTTQTQNNVFVLTGSLTADVSVIWPAIGRAAWVINNTTGSHTVTLKAGAASTTQVIPQGSSLPFIIATDSVYAFYDIYAAKLNVTNQALSGGVVVTPKDLGTISSGTVTPNPGDSPMQYYTNNGAHTLAPSSNNGYYIIDIRNGASAGAITVSGWSYVIGSFITTPTKLARCTASILNAGVGPVSVLTIQQLP